MSAARRPPNRNGMLTERERARVRAAYATPPRDVLTPQPAAQTQEGDGSCPVPLTGLVRLRDCGWTGKSSGVRIRFEGAGHGRYVRLCIGSDVAALMDWRAGLRCSVTLSAKGVAVLHEHGDGDITLRKDGRQLRTSAARIVAVTGWVAGRLSWDVRQVQGRKVLVLWQEAAGD